MRRGCILLAWLLSSGLAGACASAPEPPPEPPLERHEYRRPAMGVEARIVLYARDEETARSAADAAFARIDELEAVMSDWSPDSELSRLNARSGRGPVAVSDDLFAVLARSHVLAVASSGAYDPTLGALVALFRRQRATGVAASPGELAEARKRSGFEHLRLDRRARTVELAMPGLRLDLGGIGKGWACDRALAVLAGRGVSRAIVEIGGDLVAGDPPPGRDAWRIAATCGSERRMLEVVRAGVATSGDTDQFVVEDDLRRSHVLDPRTGRGTTGVRCVTVVAATGATADAAASALSVLGPDADLPEAAFGPLEWTIEPGVAARR